MEYHAEWRLWLIRDFLAASNFVIYLALFACGSNRLYVWLLFILFLFLIPKVKEVAGMICAEVIKYGGWLAHLPKCRAGFTLGVVVHFLD